MSTHPRVWFPSRKTLGSSGQVRRSGRLLSLSLLYVLTHCARVLSAIREGTPHPGLDGYIFLSTGCHTVPERPTYCTWTDEREELRGFFTSSIRINQRCTGCSTICCHPVYGRDRSKNVRKGS